MYIIVCKDEGGKIKKSVQIIAPAWGFFVDVCKIKNRIREIVFWAYKEIRLD